MSVLVEIEDGRIVLTGWAGDRTAQKCKSVPAAKAHWTEDKKFSHWSYPLALASCRGLREAFGTELRIGPALNAWAREEIESEKEIHALGSAKSATLVNVERHAPRIATAMANRTYQQAGAAFGARVGSFALFDEPRLGKTIQSLGAIIEAEGEQRTMNLILCPLVAVDIVWAAEVEMWLGERADAFPITGTKAQREQKLWDAGRFTDPSRDVFVICNIEMARLRPSTNENGKRTYRVEDAEFPALFEIEWDNVIVDECQRALIRTTGTPTQVRAGMKELRARRRIALSGTPSRGKAYQTWGTLNWLRPDLYTSYWRWYDTYFSRKSNGFSQYVVDTDEHGAVRYLPGAEDRLANDLRTISLRRTRAEVKPELPPKMYAGTLLDGADPDSPRAVWVEMNAAQRKLMRQLDVEGVISQGDEELIVNGHLATATRAKQIAGASGKIVGDKLMPTLPSPKFDWLIEKLDEFGILPDKDGYTEGNSKIVVTSQFTSLLNLYAEELTKLGVRLHLLTGATPNATRQSQQKDFQTNPKTRVFLLNMKAGGVAIALDAADDLVLLDETYDPDDTTQVEDRIVSMSKDRDICIWKIKTLGTIEEEIAWINAARADVMTYLLDGSRGVDVAKKIYLAAKQAA